MAVKTQEKTLGGYRYRVTQLPMLRSRALLVRLAKSLGPVLSKLVENVGTGLPSGLAGIDVATLGPAVAELAARLDEDDLAFACRELGEFTQVVGSNGKTDKLDEQLQDQHFAGRLLDMFKWLAFALEVNYADFLSARRAIVGASTASLTSEPAPSPTASTGSSGASQDLPV